MSRQDPKLPLMWGLNAPIPTPLFEQNGLVLLILSSMEIQYIPGTCLCVEGSETSFAPLMQPSR